jgi:hypothetical protein
MTPPSGMGRKRVKKYAFAALTTATATACVFRFTMVFPNVPGITS